MNYEISGLTFKNVTARNCPLSLSLSFFSLFFFFFLYINVYPRVITPLKRTSTSVSLKAPLIPPPPHTQSFSRWSIIVSTMLSFVVVALHRSNTDCVCVPQTATNTRLLLCYFSFFSPFSSTLFHCSLSLFLSLLRSSTKNSFLAR